LDTIVPVYFGLPLYIIAMLMGILFTSAVMSGLSGFGFSAIGAIALWLMRPTLAVPLLMALSTANQLLSLHQLKADMKPLRLWWPDGPGPYLLGGLAGIPIGVWLLNSLPTATLMVSFGMLLICYASYSLLKPATMLIKKAFGWKASVLVGLTGGVVGGFTAFPGAAVVIWTGLVVKPKGDIRAIVQPYILVLQVAALALLAVNHPETFNSQFWGLLMITLPVVLPGTMIGIRLYRSLSEVNFKRIAFMLLGISGMGLFVKGMGVSLRTAAALM